MATTIKKTPAARAGKADAGLKKAKGEEKPSAPVKKAAPSKAATVTKAAATKPKAEKAAAAATEAPPKKPAAAGTRRAKAPASAARGAIDAERRRHYVEVAAYFIAERRGFSGGSGTEDWLAAEQEIDRLLSEGKLSS